jgi:hypothetical protein
MRVTEAGVSVRLIGLFYHEYPGESAGGRFDAGGSVLPLGGG